MKKAILLLLITIISNLLNAQIAQNNSLPKSFNNEKSINQKTISIILPSIDVEKFLKEDDNQSKNIAQRFAAPIEVDLNLENGSWTELSNGDKIWQLEIVSKNALNLNFQFNKFKLPEGGELHVYSTDKTDVRGAFTSKNNRIDNSFAIYLINGESVIIEYYQPKNVVQLPELEIERVLHGYKSVQGYGDAGSCNNNINCPEGVNWQNEKKAVALIISGGVNGTRWCSGAMVNNVREDGTPFYLTANHCLTGTENNWAFIYNYESPNCTDIDGSFSESVLGAKVLSSGFDSDFALLLLDNIPPVNYDVYHSGWDANDILKDSVVGVHHPRGDIKKISFDYDSIEHSGYYGSGNDHWQVLDWDDGTTEPTSSGSPLYDKLHRIIGQLHGGDAACGNDDEDYYGKFSYSWNAGPLPSTQLMYWLDPDSSGITILDGDNYNTPNNTLDAALTFLNVEDYCDTLITGVEVVFKNLGSDTINSLQIRAFLDNDSLQWTTINSVLAFTEIDAFVLTDFIVDEGNHTLKIIIANPNNSIDNNFSNDTIIRYFNVKNGNQITINLNTDFFGNETGVEIYDENLNQIYSKVGFPGNSSIDIDNCLEDGCFTVKITDDFNDGIGSESIYFSNGGLIFDTVSGNFGSETYLSFRLFEGIVKSSIDSISCKIDSIIDGIINKEDHFYTVYPNPSSGIFTINSISTIENINVIDVLGKSIFSDNQILSNKNQLYLDLSKHPKGVYFLHVKSGEYLDVRKIIIK